MIKMEKTFVNHCFKCHKINDDACAPSSGDLVKSRIVLFCGPDKLVIAVIMSYNTADRFGSLTCIILSPILRPATSAGPPLDMRVT